MKSVTVALTVFATAAAVAAHPGVGIVADGKGTVYFTNLKHVWKIAADGTVSVAVPDVHSHELALDAEGNLYGEHLWADGGMWFHRTWCRKPDGTVKDVIPTREGFPRGYGFARDKAGNTYWADEGDKLAVKKTASDGRVTTVVDSGLKLVQRMTATADGTLYLMDGGDLKRVTTDGKLSTVASNLSGRSPAPKWVGERNYHMGVWTDRDGAVYVAIAREQRVVRVKADGTTSVAAESPGNWSPSGGTFDTDGTLWLLEYDPTDAHRARRIDPKGKEQVFAAEASRK
jgi:sugar lactone lactonase YvrE